MSKKRRPVAKWQIESALLPALATSANSATQLLAEEHAAGAPPDDPEPPQFLQEALLPARTKIEYTDLFIHAPVPYLIVDQIGLVNEANEAAGELLGVHRDLLRGTLFLDFIPLPREQTEARQHLIAPPRKDRLARVEVSLSHPVHKKVRVEMLILTQSKRRNGHALAYVALVDVTAASRARAELQQEIQALRTQMDSRSAEIRRLKEELIQETKQRRQLESEIIETSEREKRKFGQHLHDETCQSLTGLSFLATVIARRFADQPEAHAVLEDLAKELRKVVETTRNISWTLDPVILTGGLLSGLRELARQTDEKLPCELIGPPELELSDAVALALFRIVKEAVQNTIRHAAASAVRIVVIKSRQRVSVSVEDNGCGIKNPELQKEGALGIHMMRYRARSIGAELRVEHLPSGGTRVCCIVPWEANENRD